MSDSKIQLTRALKSRHIFMLSLGGVIGTGLFMGAGVTINQGGPAGAVLAYLVAGLLMYLVIAITQLCMRRKLRASGEPLAVEMWAFPWLTLATIALIVGILAIMSVFPGHRGELLTTLGLSAVLAGIGLYLQKRQPQLSAQRAQGGFGELAAL